MNSRGKLAQRFNLTFVDENNEVILDYTKTLKSIPGMNFISGNIFNYGPGTLVSPANSYGDMNGGIDIQYKQRFNQIEDRLLEFIAIEHGNKLEIGKAQIIPTYDKEFPHIIFSPTVKRFGDLSSKSNVYEAMKSVLKKSLEFNIMKSPQSPIKKLLIPGLGTGSGGLSPIDSAESIKKAYLEVNDIYSRIQEELKFY